MIGFNRRIEDFPVQKRRQFSIDEDLGSFLLDDGITRFRTRGEGKIKSHSFSINGPSYRLKDRMKPEGGDAS